MNSKGDTDDPTNLCLRDIYNDDNYYCPTLGRKGRPMTFKPQDHISSIRGKDYLEVKWRLVWFREEHPAGRIDTELVNHDPVLMKATISSDDKTLASGYGTAKTQGVATSRPYEGAETAAIGRALAHAGYGTQFTGESEGENLADSPVQNGNGSTPTTTKTRPMSADTTKKALIGKAAKYLKDRKTASDKQRNLLPIVLSECFADDNERHAVTEYLFRVTSTKKLSDGQVLATLDWLGLEKDEHGKYIPSADAVAEIKSLVSATMVSQGQQELEL